MGMIFDGKPFGLVHRLFYFCHSLVPNQLEFYLVFIFNNTFIFDCEKIDAIKVNKLGSWGFL